MSSDAPVWIDVSVTLKTGMAHWPGDRPVRIERVKDMERGDAANLSALSFSAHAGTHMDAPRHFIRAGIGLEEMPLEATIGPARVIEIHDPECIKPAELEPHRLVAGERILFKTRNSVRCWSTDAFVEDFVYIPLETARYLRDRRVRTVGVDYLSVGGYRKDGEEVHQTLLGAGIWIIEGLDLSCVEPGEYELICLPIKILASDGAPARAVLRKR